MASRLFKLQKEDADSGNYKSFFDRSNFFQPSKCGNIRFYFMDCLPKKCVCCKRNRKEIGIQKSIEALNMEVDIIEMIKIVRYTKMALRHLLPADVRMDLKQRSRYICIDPD